MMMFILLSLVSFAFAKTVPFFPLLPHLFPAISFPHGESIAIPSKSTTTTPCHPTIVAQPIKPVHCGQSGTLARPHPTQSLKQSSLIACANTCLDTPYVCVSFSFSKQDGTCQLYSTSLDAMGYNESETGTVTYYNRQCYACTNLLQNGNFEDGSWRPWTQSSEVNNCTSFQVESPGFQGQYAGSLSVTQPGCKSIDLQYPNFNLTTGQEYLLSFETKVDTAGCAVALETLEGLLILLGDYENIASGTHTFLGSWHHYSVPFVATGADGLTISVTCGNSSSPDGVVVHFDNLQIVPNSQALYTSSSKPTAPNLVTQPNFESGTLDAYHKIAYNTNYSIVQPGASGAAYAVKADFPSSGLAVFGLSQRVPSVKNGVYLLSVDYKIGSNQNDLLCQLALVSTDAAFSRNYEMAGLAPYNVAYNDPINGTVGSWNTVSGIVGMKKNAFVGLLLSCTQEQSVEVGNILVEPLF